MNVTLRAVLAAVLLAPAAPACAKIKFTVRRSTMTFEETQRQAFESRQRARKAIDEGERRDREKAARLRRDEWVKGAKKRAAGDPFTVSLAAGETHDGFDLAPVLEDFRRELGKEPGIRLAAAPEPGTWPPAVDVAITLRAKERPALAWINGKRVKKLLSVETEVSSNWLSSMTGTHWTNLHTKYDYAKWEELARGVRRLLLDRYLPSLPAPGQAPPP